MYFPWKPYVPAASRRRATDRTVAKLQKKGQTLSPVTVGRAAIATSFWGNAWCQNLERYRDYSNRLPRGRTYLRNDRPQDRSRGSDRPSHGIQPVPHHRQYQGSGLRTLAGDCARLLLLHRHIGRVAPGATVDLGDGAHHPSWHRPLSVTAGDCFQLQLSGCGRDVQACRGDALRNRRPARLGTGTSISVAKSRRE